MSNRRNIVIVVAHGLRADALGDSRAWPLATPGLESLGRRGLRGVASSACPADCGGMLSLLTGAHSRQHGYLDQTRGVIPCEGWPALLKEAGYHMAGVGLVGGIEAWLQDVVLIEDVDQVEAPRCRYMETIQAKGLRAVVEGQRRQRRRSGPFEPDRLLLEPEEDVDGFIFAQARLALDHMPEDKPWVLVVILSGPGNDLPPPTLYDGLVDRKELAAGFIPPDLRAIDGLAELDYPRIMLQRMEPRTLANIRADYLGRVAQIDYGVSSLNAGVQERGDRGRSWMVVCSDRGHLLGEQGLIGHRSFLCGAIEVPFIVASPEPPEVKEASPETPPDIQDAEGAAPDGDNIHGAGRFHDGLVSTVDIAATIAALGGCEMPSSCVGRSLLAALKDDAGLRPIPGGCLSEFGKRLMLETERYKAIFNIETLSALGLYDLLNDPDEKQNLVETPIGVNLLDALRWRVGEALLPLRGMPGGVVG